MAKQKEDKRPPVVVVLGHVDHGKTTLLDYIRKTHVAASEAGGITQSIGAYKIFQPTKITFIDTPGHEAFSTMRSHGAKVADLAVLLVAADDSVKPQTEESVKYINAAKIPFLVAINKIDLPEADVEKVKKDLLRINVASEGYGGDIVAIEVSAKTGRGIEELLEMIGLVAKMQAELDADKGGSFTGVVIESSMDQRSGPLATVLVKNGTLKVKDYIETESVVGRVKAMFDDRGKTVQEAGPSDPVVVLGLSRVAETGALVYRKDEKTEKPAIKAGAKSPAGEKIAQKDAAIRLIVKANSKGSLQSVLDNLPPAAKVLQAEVAETINKSDIEFSVAAKAAIVGFNVSMSNTVARLAETEKIVVRLYNLIFELIEEIDDVVAELTRQPEEKTTGRAKVLAVFQINNLPVAGVRVEEGNIRIGDKIKVEHDTGVSRGKVVSIKDKKVEVKVALPGGEFGIGVTDDLDFSVGDVIIAYNIK